MSFRLFGVVHSAAAEDAALAAMRSGEIAWGPYVEAFRRGFAARLGTPNVVTLDNMSSAMTIALRLAGVRPGDGVVTSPFSCLSANAPIATAGAVPVWCDVDRATGLPGVEQVAACLGEGTRAVILYHLAGYPADADAIAALCRARGVALIEDCDSALGATLGGRAVGSFGDFAVYSFYPNRQINALEGGALVCRSDADHARAMRLRRFGVDRTKFRDPLGEILPEEDVAEIGWSAALGNVASGVALAGLGGLAERLARTRRNALRLTEQLRGMDGIVACAPIAGADPVYWTLLARARARDRLLMALKGRGVEASRLHQRNDHYTGFGTAARPLDGIDAWTGATLSLPCGWWLADADIDQIAEIVGEEARAVGGS